MRMKTFLKYSVLFIYAVLFQYTADILGVPKNIYYLLIGFPLLLGGALLILHLFERNGVGKKESH